MAADDRRAAGEVAEGDGPHDALGLADDVVVHHHRVGRGALADGLELAAGVAAGAAEVALLVDDQQVAERLLGEREELVVGDLLGALLGDEHRVQVGPQRLVLADLGEQLGAEVRLVDRGDDDVDGAVLLAVGGHLGGPLGRLDDGVLVAGDDVVPVPAAVDERRQRQVEVEGLAGVPTSTAVDGRGVDALRAAVGHGLVDRHAGAPAGDRDRQPHLADDAPAAPVGRGEAVEVRAERHLAALLHPERRARQDLVGVHRAAGRGGLPDGGVVEVLGGPVAADVVAVGVEPRLLRVDVQREHVGVAVDREDLALEQAAHGRRRLVHGLGCGGRHSSTPPEVSVAPSAKCGLSLFSYIESADPMAMCMSRYL